MRLERERLERTPTLASAFPSLKSLSVVVGHFESQRGTPSGELRYRANIQHAKAVLTFSCPASGCRGGGFDLTEILRTAVRGKRKTVQGEIACGGTRSNALKHETACPHLLRYKLNLSYV